MITALTQPLKTLLRGAPEELAALLRDPASGLRPYLVAVVLGGAAYGAAIGLWRAEVQAVYVAMKMPLLVLLTLAFTGLLNGILGQILGAGLSFAQSLRASLMCFATFSMIVGSLSPIMVAMVLDAPGPGAPGAEDWYRGFLLVNTGIIAFAGIVANQKLLRTLVAFSGSADVAFRTLLAWLAGNLFVGAQLSYNLRPFFSNPTYPVELLRPEPFDSTFYQVLWGIMVASMGQKMSILVLMIAAVALANFLFVVRHRLQPKPNP
jgi:hypothetical protein